MVAGSATRTRGLRGCTGVLLTFAVISALACGSSPSPPAPTPSPSAPAPPGSVLEMIEACLDSRGHHPVLEEYARALFEGSAIEIDRTLHGIGDIDGDGEVQLTMVVSHPRRKAMRVWGALHLETCDVEIIYPPQQGTPYDRCQYLSERGDYGPCELNDRGDCTCSPE